MADPRTEPIFPTASLGELLAAKRAGAGLSLDDVGQASGLAVDRVAAVEAGRHDLSDVELLELLDRYPTPSQSGRLAKSVVEIDLDGCTLRLRRVRRPRSVPLADQNLLRYLELVHERFGVEPGADIPLKAVDLGLLRASLALRREEVTGRLDRMTGGIGPRIARHRNLLVAAAATGLVVAAGAVVLIPARSAREEPSPTIDPRIDIGTPLVVERDPADIPPVEPMVRPEAEPGAASGEETGLGPATASATGPAGETAIGPAPGSTELAPIEAQPLPQSLAATAQPGPVSAPRIGTPLVVERPAADIAPTPPDPADRSARGPPGAVR